MGNCTLESSNTQISGLYDSIMKCPDHHWLAFFQTPQCSICHNRSLTSIATISCTSCLYSLCNHCFERKFRNWQKSVSNLSSRKAKRLRNKLRQELQQMGRVLWEEKEQGRSQRLRKYLEEQAVKYGHLRGDEGPINEAFALQSRIGTLARLCLQVYETKRM